MLRLGCAPFVPIRRLSPTEGRSKASGVGWGQGGPEGLGWREVAPPGSEAWICPLAALAMGPTWAEDDMGGAASQWRGGGGELIPPAGWPTSKGNFRDPEELGAERGSMTLDQSLPVHKRENPNPWAAQKGADWPEGQIGSGMPMPMAANAEISVSEDV